jgi:non-canonical purine NTP pyrophosphatase (RdgB/HAM1 family)
MRVLVIGTGNRHKVREIAPLLEGLPLSLRAAGDYGPFHPDESGATAEENAVIKARAAMELSGQWAIADDTGLEIDALGGRPGNRARKSANTRRALKRSRSTPKKSARSSGRAARTSSASSRNPAVKLTLKTTAR